MSPFTQGGIILALPAFTSTPSRYHHLKTRARLGEQVVWPAQADRELEYRLAIQTGREIKEDRFVRQAAP